MTAEQVRTIVSRCTAGEYEQFGALYDYYCRRVYDFIYFKTHHTETAEDLASVTWTKAIERLSSFDPDKGSFQSWIYKIAQNTVIDHYRAKRDLTAIDDSWDIASGEDIERDAHARHSLELIQKHLGALDSRQRDILIMRLWQELSYAEIAEIMNISEGSAKMTVSRGLAKLRATMPIGTYLLFLLMRSL